MDIQEQQNGAPAAMPACCTLEQPCSVPFLSLDLLPPPFPPTFSTTLLPRCPLYPALRRCPLSSRPPPPLPVSFSLYTVPRTFSVSLSPSRLFLAVLATWLLASASSISFIDIGRPPSFSPPSRSYASPRRSNLSVLLPAFHPFVLVVPLSLQREHTLDRVYPLVLHPTHSTLSQSLALADVAYPACTLTIPHTGFSFFHSFRPLALSLLLLFCLSRCRSSDVRPFLLHPLRPRPFHPAASEEATPPSPCPTPVCPDIRPFTRHYHVHPTFLFVSLEIPPHPRHALVVVDRRGGSLRTCKLE